MPITGAGQEDRVDVLAILQRGLRTLGCGHRRGGACPRITLT